MNEFFEKVGKRLQKLNIEDLNGQRNELREITQEILLSGLANEGFFNNAVFMGGTVLRLNHGLTRYSEDLDFRFLKFDDKFDWEKYKIALSNYVKMYGSNLTFFDEKAGDLKRVIINNNKLIESIHKNKVANLQWAKTKQAFLKIFK